MVLYSTEANVAFVPATASFLYLDYVAGKLPRFSAHQTCINTSVSRRLLNSSSPQRHHNSLTELFVRKPGEASMRQILFDTMRVHDSTVTLYLQRLVDSYSAVFQFVQRTWCVSSSQARNAHRYGC